MNLSCFSCLKPCNLLHNKMRILFTANVLWILLIFLEVKGQSDCPRTNRQARRRCVTSCDPANGCVEPEDECLCDGDCGYSCVQKDLSCGRPPSVPEATAQYQSTAFGAVATYVCNSGYTLSGASQRTCRANKRWDAVGPNCLKMCSIPEIPFSTYIKSPQEYNRTYKTGERIVLACKKGFELQGENNNPTRICISGRWTQFPFRCQGTHACKRTIRPARTKCTQECSPESGCASENLLCLCDGTCGYSCVEKGMSCGDPPAISNGKLNFTGTSYNDTAHYTCEDGFSLNTSPVKRCTAKKRWDGLTPRCLRDCGDPAIPKNAIISNPSDNYPSGYKVKFKCNEGYNQEGMATQMCFQGGWTVLPFKCSEGGCGDPGTPFNGRKVGVIYSVNSIVYFDCDLGYELVGSEKRKCQSNGTWTGEQPVCQVVDCGFPPKPKNGRYIGNQTTFQSLIRFECDQGYELIGFKERMCTSDKTWSRKDVTCAAVNCGKLLPPMNGSMLGEETAFPNQVQFSCDEGFILRGSQRRTCQADRTWSGNATFCDAVDCGALPPPMNGSSEGDDTTFPNTIIFKCDIGFDLIGSRSRKCMTDNKWSGVMPVCKAVDCGKLLPPTNGSLVGEETIFPNHVDIRCDEGFILRGSHLRTCQADRTWSGDSTFCEAVDCGEPLSLRNGSITGKSTSFPNFMHLSCDEGFVLNGSSKIQCQANRMWSKLSSFCSAKDCGPLAVPLNGSLSGTETTFPNEALFSCDQGFLLNGSAVRRCQADGSWSGMQTACKAVDCGPLRVPLNGSSSGNSTVFPNSILFDCDPGFILNGSSSRKCQANRTWTGFTAVCVAVDCGPLSVPTNGSSSGDSTVYPNSVLFDCDPGFILNGSSERTCRPNGTWSGFPNLCIAQDCGRLPVPKNGSSVGDLTVFPNKILFDCDQGFNMRGSSLRHCQENGIWSGNLTNCEAVDCGSLSTPLNGSSYGQSTVFPNSVLFNCDFGFILNGSTLRTCQANGTWSGFRTVCEAVDCGALPAPMNGSSSGASTVFPDSILFNCDPGFLLNGSSLRMCQANGTWSGSSTSCVAIDCGRPQLMQNGSITGRSTVHPNIMHLSCDEGFILRGSSEIQCQTNGTWTKTSSFCEAKDCGQLAVPLNGSYSGRATTFPNEAIFSCDEGFNLNGSPLRRCLSNGSWSGTETFCEAVDCGPLFSPMNGSSFGDASVFPNSVLFTCDPGFILNGSSSRTCRANGTWSGMPVVCNARDCGPLPVPRNASSTGNLTTFPNKIEFGCDKGFNLVGSDVRYCQENGTWSGNRTFCKAVNCGHLSVPINGTSVGDSAVFPNSVLFKCDSGFILSGSSKRTCEANGTWSGFPTVCDAVDCGPLLVPINGSSSGDSTVFPNSVLFNCDPGFILNGSFSRTCQADGTWSGSSTACVAVDCGAPQPLQNGNIIGMRTVYPNIMHLSCDEGFFLRGSSEIQCQTNGTWSKTSSFCEAKDCGPLSLPSNGSYVAGETTFPSEATFSCHEGFILKGSEVRRCQANGSWSGSNTSCQAVDCGLLSVPPNGALSGSLTVFPNFARFSCDSGYILRGSFSRMCLANGTWSGIQPVCTPVDCGLPQPFRNGSLSGNTTVFPGIMRLACDAGFTLHGTPEMRCQANGTWSRTGAFCEAINCGKLSEPLNGTMTGSKTSYPNEAGFKCDEGFELQGSITRKCEANGQWSGEDVKCQAVDCGPITVPEYAVSHGSTTTYPSVITFSCKQGFFPHGESIRRCQADGTWTSGEIQCRGMDCGLLKPPENGWMFGSETSHPHNVSFTCRTGYRLIGPSKRTCLRNGSWSGDQPKCLAHWCSKAPEVPVFAYQTWRAAKLRYEHGENIYYSCKPGFIMVGIPKRQCIMGEWSPIKFRCSAPSCNAPVIPKLSYVTSARGSQSRYLDGEKVYYTCHTGYELVGIPEVECQNGVWTTPRFSCEPVSCGTLPTPSNGVIQRHTGTTYTKVYVFRCKDSQGYLMRGSAERRCLANATWSGLQPVCYMQTCNAPLHPRYGKVTPELSKYIFGNVVLYQCNGGFSVRGHKTTRCQISGNWTNPVPTCVSCSSPLGLQNRMIFNHKLSASSERDSWHAAKHGRLHGDSAWCSARSSLHKYFQIDFGRMVEVTAVATQGHPREHKWVLRYVLKYSLGKHWLTYQESGQEKVFQGNRDRNSVVKHHLKEQLVAKRLRIFRYQNSRDFIGSTACLRAEVYGCYFESECLAIGSEVFARWNSINKHTRYFHGFITKIRKTSVEVTPSGNHGATVNNIMELPRAEKYYVIIDKQSKPSEIRTGAEVIVASDDRMGFSQGKVTQKFSTWYGVELGNGKKVWSKARDIRLLKSPVYCDRE